MSDKDFSLFYFETVDRPFIINKHNFYVTEARKRIFAQFSDPDLEAAAQQKEEEYYEEAGKNFNPDYHDEGDVVEQAYNEGISHWIALCEMKNTVSLALTAGMFHQFDKELREKCIREFSHWLNGEVIASMIWDIGFPRLIEILEWIGMDITGKDYYGKIDTCRQIVNVYKHGDGDAHRKLSAEHPEYYHSFSMSENYRLSLRHEQLEVTEVQFIEFADAITAFWKNIPINCMFSAIRVEPQWFYSEFAKHEKKAKKNQV